MGSGISSSLHDEEDGHYDFNNIPKYGVRLSFCQKFIDSCGGRDKLIEVTTEDVCYHFIKPATKEIKAKKGEIKASPSSSPDHTTRRSLSYCEMLLRSQNKEFSAAVGVANVFISHTWSSLFLDVIDALVSHFDGRLDETVVWMDIFSVNQHLSLPSSPFRESEEIKEGSRDIHGWWIKTFPEFIASIGHTVVVFSPWYEAAPLSRLWCLWEMFLTIQHQCRFEIAIGNHIVKTIENKDDLTEGMKEKDQPSMSFWEELTAINTDDLDEDYQNARVTAVVGGVKHCYRRLKKFIHFEHSECSFESDGRYILEAMKYLTAQGTSSDRWSEVNHAILDRLWHWTIATVEAEIQKQRINSKPISKQRPVRLMFALARMYGMIDNHGKSVGLLRECLELLQKELDDTTHDNSKTKLDLEITRVKVALADSLLRTCDKHLFVIGSNITTPSPPTDTVTTDHDKKIFQEVETLYLDSLSKRQDCLEPTNKSIMSLMKRIIYFYEHVIASPAKTKTWLKEKLLLLQQQESVAMAHDPEVIQVMNHLASLAIATECFIESASYYEDILESHRAALGDNHPETLQTMNNLGVAYFQCYNQQHQQLHTPLSSNNGGEREKLMVAKTILQECLKGRRELLNNSLSKSSVLQQKTANQNTSKKKGICNEGIVRDILVTMKNLVTVYRAEATLMKVERSEVKSKKRDEKEHLDFIVDYDAMEKDNLEFDKLQLERVISLQEDCLSQCQKLLGIAHPETLSAMMILGELYWEQSLSTRDNDMKEKAIRILEDCLSLQRDILGNDHLETLSTIQTLAYCYHNECFALQSILNESGVISKERNIKFETARKLYEECLSLQACVLGDTHPDTFRTRKNLEILLQNTDLNF